MASLSSFCGGRGRMSSCVTEMAPWRNEVPMQSDAVSPPPMTTTCLPVDRIGSSLADILAADAAILLHEIGHGEMHAVELGARQRRVARVLGAAGEQHRVMTGVQLGEAHRDADIDAVVERRRPRPPSGARGARYGASPS